MRVNEFPKEFIHKKVFLCSPDNPLTWFQKKQMAYYIFPEYIPDIFCCIDLFMLMTSNSLLQSHFFKSHPSLKGGLNVAFFMESSMISVLLQNTKALPPRELLITFITLTTYYLLWWLLCILCIYPTML